MGASREICNSTRSLLLSFPLFLSGGKLIVAGKLVHSPVGLARLLPVKVSSSDCPRCAPLGNGILMTGARGFGATGAGFCESARSANVSKASKKDSIPRKAHFGARGSMIVIFQRSVCGWVTIFVGGETIAAAGNREFLIDLSHRRLSRKAKS